MCPSLTHSHRYSPPHSPTDSLSHLLTLYSHSSLTYSLRYPRHYSIACWSHLAVWWKSQSCWRAARRRPRRWSPWSCSATWWWRSSSWRRGWAPRWPPSGTSGRTSPMRWVCEWVCEWVSEWVSECMSDCVMGWEWWFRDCFLAWLNEVLSEWVS